MKHMFTYEEHASSTPRRTLMQPAFLLITAFIFLIVSTASFAQNTLLGLTSNGGPAGKGAAFSIGTNGTNFSVISGFADWGKTPIADLYKNDDGNFYGTTSGGGTYTDGSIFMMTAAGDITILKQLNITTDGAYPNGELIKGADGNFYGMTSAGGANSYGTIFKITPAGVFTVIRNFNIATDGSNPRGHLVLAGDGNFYGITYGGGANGAGTIFKLTPAGVFTVIHSMNKTTEGGNSYSSLTVGKDGNLYGVTYAGGTFSYGTIFKCTTAGMLTVLHHMNATTDGANIQSDLLQATDGNFYATAFSGGAGGVGTIFKITPAGVFTVLRSLTWTTDGSNPYGNLYQDSDGFLYGAATGAGANGNGVFFKISTAGAYTVLHSFSSATEGAAPKSGVVKGADGNFYGTTSTGGTNGWGTAYKITAAGVLTALAQFDGSSMGNVPYESLIKGSDSAYYGTTSTGGAYGAGTVFKICGGVTTVLHAFNKTVDGGVPRGSLLQASDGNFYGMTGEGGPKTYGTIFKITPSGNFTVMHSFNSPTDGGNAQGSLIQGKDGYLYGMTNAGGSSGGGTIFKMSLTGTFTVLHQFVSATDGANPEGSLVQATDRFFYGVTNNNAKIFRIDSVGTFTVLHSFSGNTEGSNPVGSLIQGTDGKLYGTASYGGSSGAGTIYSVTTTGTVKVLRQLNGTADGKTPKGSLLQAGDGNFYGMTSAGGAYNVGTIFKLTAAGAYTVIKNLSMDTTGGNPYGSLIIAAVNNLIANAQSVTTNEDTKKAISLTGSGGSPLTFTIVTNPKHGKLTGNGANKTYTPTANYNGADQFAFSVSVGCMSSAPAIVSISVTPVADTPVLAAIGNKTVAKNTTLIFTASATDADKGQTITYSLIGAPAGASINATTGVFTWTPTATGSFTFKVRATDNGTPALYDEEQITVTVTAALQSGNIEAAQQKTSYDVQATLYPNPVDDKFFVSLPVPVNEITIRIIDMKGVVITTQACSATGKNTIEVDASKLVRGMYIAQLEISNGKQSLKFIKK